MRRARALRLLLVAAVAGIAWAPAAQAAQWIQQGAEPGQACSATAEASAPGVSCLVQFGQPFGSDAAIVKLGGFGMALWPSRVVIARPASGGGWAMIRADSAITRWKSVGDGWYETAISVKPGDRLLIDSPQVIPGGSAPTFADTGSLTEGTAIAALPIGKVLVEPDVDGDGYGDESTDLCVGVDGMVCEPGAASAAVWLSGTPQGGGGGTYVQGRDSAAAGWAVANTAPTPQPFLVSLVAPPGAAQTFPPGTACVAAGATPAETLIPSAARSALLKQALDALPGQGLMLPPWPYRALAQPQDGTTRVVQICRLPVLAPGAAVSGTFVWPPGVGAHRLDVTAISSIASLNGGVGPWADGATGTIGHGYPAKTELRSFSKISRGRRLAFHADCAGGGIGGLGPCSMTAELRVPTGKRQLLGQTAAARPMLQATGATLTVKLSSSGVRWLAKHRTSRVELQVTIDRDGEFPVVVTKKVKPSYTGSMRAYLKKLAKPKKKSKKKR